MSPKVSVIISARNEEEHIENTIKSMVFSTSYKNYEIIAINDGSTDKTENILGTMELPCLKTLKTNNLGTAKARNFGTRFAKGEILIFSDAHMTMFPEWLEKIVETYNNYDFDLLTFPIATDNKGIERAEAAYGMTLNNKLKADWLMEKPPSMSEIPISPGAFMIFKKNVFTGINGFDSGFNNWGHEDVEISIKTWLRGYRIKILTSSPVKHFFRKYTPFKIEMVDFLYNLLRMGFLHFNEERIEKLKEIIYEMLKQNGYNPEKDSEKIIKRIENTDILKQREEYFKIRKYSDDWYFNKFKIDF